MLANASVLTLGAAPLPVLPPGHDHSGGVHIATTGNHSELVETLPITPREGAQREVVMSLGPDQLPALRTGDRLQTSAEVQFSTTCAEKGQRCIGHHYDYDPLVGASVKLADGPTTTGGDGAKLLDERRTVRCRQRRPNRNHHCMLVFTWSTERLRAGEQLPCDPRQCYVNVVMDASNPAARHGDVIVLGGDRPDGTVEQDKGRLNATLIRDGASATRASFATTTPLASQVPVDDGLPSRTVVYSQELDDLQKGDKLRVGAGEIDSISGLGYPVYLGSELILAESPDATEPGTLSKKVGSLHGRLDEANGFNCTQGPSAYQTPCETRKVGVLKIRENPVAGLSRVPLYLNLVTRAKALLATPDPTDFATVEPGGHVTVVRYRH